MTFIHRQQIADAQDPEAERERLAAEYAEQHSTAAVAARNGSIDELLEPAETRDRLAWVLATLEPTCRRPPGAPTGVGPGWSYDARGQAPAAYRRHDHTRACALLGDEDRAPEPDDYLPKLLGYALKARWGKRSLTRQQARADASDEAAELAL